MPPVARRHAGRLEDGGGREGESAACVELARDLVVEFGDERGRAREDERLLEARTLDRERAWHLRDGEPGQLDAIERRIELVGKDAEVADLRDGRKGGATRKKGACADRGGACEGLELHGILFCHDVTNSSLKRPAPLFRDEMSALPVIGAHSHGVVPLREG
jgi:hypothetical protein